MATLLHRSVLSLLPLLALGLSACGDTAGPGDDPPAGPVSALPEDADLRRARAAALTNATETARDLDGAWEAIAPLVEREDAVAEDLLRGAVIAFHRQGAEHEETARALVERAADLAPDDPRVAFVRGNVLMRAAPLQADMEAAVQEALASYRQVVAARPDEAPAWIQIADACSYLNSEASEQEELEAWQRVRDLGLGPNRTFYCQAVYRLSRLAYRRARQDPDARAEGDALVAEYEALKARGIEPASDTEITLGALGRVPGPERNPPGPAAPTWPTFDEWLAFDTPGRPHLLQGDVDADGRLDLLAWGPGGVSLLRRTDAGFDLQVVHERPVSLALLGDLDDGNAREAPEPGDPVKVQHPALELLTLEDGAPLLTSFDPDTGHFVPLGLGGLEATDYRAAALVDLDHEGDLDLVLGGDRGLEYRRNDGAEQPFLRSFTTVRPDVMTALGPVTSLILEDVDDNQAVDLLGTTADGRLFAIANRWSETFEDGTALWGLDGASCDERTAAGGLIASDRDGDSLVDLTVLRADGASVLPGTATGFGAPVALAGAPLTGRVAVADLDRDGRPELVGDNGAWHGRAPGWAPEAPHVLDEAGGEPLLADLDGDGALDLALGGDSLRLLTGTPPAGRGAVTISLEGMEDNRRAVGAIVEMLAGDTYRRIFWRGVPEVLGLGEADQLDVLTVRWPNGVHHPELSLAAGEAHHVVQIQGPVGSCPFLYTWNGTTYEFITDVLGTTPLGLPFAPGQHVPFDHDEYVKVRGDQLVPRDGRLDLVLTEELREVTYLDRARLHAIDHPAGTEIQPNERFSFPPFAEHHVHTLTDVVAPVRAVASNGEDVTELVASVDGRHARPFVHRPAQFEGLTEPWFVELTLAETEEQRAALAAAPRLRLAFTGWLLWGDASVNLAAARHPAVSFDPPVLLVPDGEGGWIPTGPPVGFPAGKTKTMVLDVTDVIDRDDPRLRVATTLALSWDAIRLVRDGDDAPFTDTPLEPLSAEVAYRGFSAPLPDPSGEFSARFDWDAVDSPRWDQHPGRYTRYGDVLPLLTAIDDRTVIFGSGDAVFLSFDATALPPLPEGWTRDWLLFVDGWAKDGDPNTSASHAVGPLPFHGMSDYPPPPGEAFPDTPELRAWDAEYNTRPARRLLPRLIGRAGR